MKQWKKRSISLLLTAVLLLTFCLPATAADALQRLVDKSAAYMLQTVKAPQVGSIGGEWAVMGLARSGYSVPQSYWDDYYDAVEDYVASCKGVLHKKKYTEYSRVVIALTAIGADPTNVAGYNLLVPLGDFEKTVWQGINGPIFALIALDCGNYPMPVNTEAATQATRQLYLNEILSRQNDDGGWSLTSKGGAEPSDPDVTAMALQAFAKYQDDGAVKTATERALTCLSKMQDSDGGYASYKTANSESVVQVIVALCELGIDLEDRRFVKNGNTLLGNLLSYRKADGSFSHTSAIEGNDQMASEQGFYGLVAALRMAEGENSLYCMDDGVVAVSGQEKAKRTGLPGKHNDVQIVPINAPGTTFGDIANHKNRGAIEGLAARGVITGFSTDRFAPNETVTRAQFAAIVVRGLGLPQQTVKQFADVPANAWYAPFVGAAYTYGIVNGRSSAKFDPNGTITRQEAATMVARAANLCGMDTARRDYEILNTLSVFGDYVTAAQWAKESLAFCYDTEILNGEDWNIEPARAALRCEIAQMLFAMLQCANLL